MLVNCLLYLLWSAALSGSLCVIGALATYFLQGEAQAWGLIKEWILDFDGLLVGATGYGLLFFVRNRGKGILAQLTNIIVVPSAHLAEITRLHDRTTSWKWANLISIPMTVVGGTVLWKCGFPLEGFARMFLALSVISLYYVASTILAFFIYSLILFNRLDEYSLPMSGERVCTKKASALAREVIDNFFIICSAMGLIAIYVGFRGTLTANFTNNDKLFHSLLVLPIILYLPAALCYSLYPRYVLRQIFERDILVKISALEDQIEGINPLGLKERLELSKLIYDVKEKMSIEGKGSPLLGFKDAPSLTIGLLIVAQFVLQKDSLIRDFLRTLIK